VVSAILCVSHILRNFLAAESGKVVCDLWVKCILLFKSEEYPGRLKAPVCMTVDEKARAFAKKSKTKEIRHCRLV
jgi:hypothetical protein